MTPPELNRRSFLNASAGVTLAGAAIGSVGAETNSQTTADDDKLASRWKANPRIQHDRQVALDILKPSKRQLEHGLELHANSLVFDTYGFSPRAAVNGSAIANAVKAGASDIELQDLREEMSMTRYVSEPRERAEYLDAWNASGVTCIFQNAGEEGQDPLRMLKRLARFTFATDMLKDEVSKAVVPDDIVQAKKNGKRCLYLTTNGVPLTQDWVSTPDELRYLKVFFHLGIRMMHLTYQRRNMIGDGCAEKANAGLSDFGRIAVAEMNKVGVIPDCAHTGWQTSLEAARISTKPMVASHTSCASIQRHIRSKPDDVIAAIVKGGGLIGICCIPRYLGRTGDINALLDHVEYVAKKFGVDHVGIGTDVAYTSQNAAAERKKIPRRPKSRSQWRSLWPADPFKTTANMNASIAWTNWPLFTVGLVQRGYSDKDIQKIIGGNMLRVCEAALK